MLFFTYNQNNSGGRLVLNDDIGNFVIIQAPNARMANALAESVGVYFEGGNDCKCCGRRWMASDDDDGKEQPTIYDSNVYDEKIREWIRPGTIVVVHYINGAKERLVF